jgi:hypothetical protein
MKYKIILLMSLSLGAGVGCTHLHLVDGPISKTEMPSGIKVGIGSQEVKEGDKVVVIKSVCKTAARGRVGQINQCFFENSGEARVVSVLGIDSAIVQPDEGVILDSSMRVEKR